MAQTEAQKKAQRKYLSKPENREKRSKQEAILHQKYDEEIILTIHEKNLR